jgi:hypothetical protein
MSSRVDCPESDTNHPDTNGTGHTPDILRLDPDCVFVPWW